MHLDDQSEKPRNDFRMEKHVVAEQRISRRSSVEFSGSMEETAEPRPLSANRCHQCVSQIVSSVPNYYNRGKSDFEHAGEILFYLFAIKAFGLAHSACMPDVPEQNRPGWAYAQLASSWHP